MPDPDAQQSPQHSVDRTLQDTVAVPYELPNSGVGGMRVACVLVTHLRAKVEMGRQPHLKERPVLIVDRSQGRPAVVDRFPSASGVAAGMTLEQALSR